MLNRVTLGSGNILYFHLQVMATGQSSTQTQPPRENRVHFPDDQVLQHDSKIVLERGLSDDELNAHLGFLQINHCYEVKFEIEDSLGEVVTWDSSKATCAVMLAAKPSSGAEGRRGHKLVLHFQSPKEKLITEEITLVNSKRDKQLTLFLHARILGNDKGTPVLREGIHCIKKNDPDDPTGQRSEFVRSDSMTFD